MGRPFTTRSSLSLIDTDNVGGARLATEHLISIGRRRIATITGPADMSAGIDRLEGWRQALRAAGLPDHAVVTGDFTLDGGAQAARELVERFPEVDAVFIASDLMAAGAMPVLSAAGRSMPEDLAIIGYDNSGLAVTTKPALTTITQPVVAMARAAGAELIAQLRGEPPRTAPMIFEPELVVRDSA
jgi:DNA-binding LacI/PurR family transcriptional regulator